MKSESCSIRMGFISYFVLSISTCHTPTRQYVSQQGVNIFKAFVWKKNFSFCKRLRVFYVPYFGNEKCVFKVFLLLLKIYDHVSVDGFLIIWYNFHRGAISKRSQNKPRQQGLI